MMAAGSSVRGLSEVTTTKSASSAAIAAHLGPLGPVPVAAAAEQGHGASLGKALARCESTFSRLSGRVGSSR